MVIVRVLGRRTKVQVSAIFCDETEVSAAQGGENLRLRLTGVDEEDVQPGFVVCDPTAVVPVVSYFQAQLQVPALLPLHHHTHAHTTIIDCFGCPCPV